MGGGCLWLELDNLLLLWADQPAFSAWLSRWFVGDAVTGQVGGATATEDIAAEHLLPERRTKGRMPNCQLGRRAASSRKLVRPQGLNGARDFNGNKIDG